MQILKIPPGPKFLDHAMAYLMPILRRGQAVILVPTAAQIMPIKQALHRQGSNFLLPRIMTLDYWLEDLPPVPEVLTTFPLQRLVLVHQALKSQVWLRQALGAQADHALFNLAQTLVTLCDELSEVWLPRFAQQVESDVTIPFTEILEQALEQAYTHLYQRVLGEETQLLLAFWRTLCEPNSPVMLRWQNLQRLAQQVTGSVIWLSPNAPSGCDASFLKVTEGYAEVIQIYYDWSADAASAAGEAATLNVLHRAWAELDSAVENTVVQHARSIQVSASHVIPNLNLILCRHFEDQAMHAAHLLMAWLDQGLTNLAVVAQDRFVARRIQALLARVGIHVRDETGWKISTTRAATTIMRWFELLTSMPTSKALLDWLKSPFVLAHHVQLKEEIALLEQVMRRYAIDSGWHNWSVALAHVEVEDAVLLANTQKLLTELQRSAIRWSAGKKSLLAWCHLLDQTLDELGIRPLLSQDTSGVKLLQVLQDLIESSAHVDDGKFSLNEFRALLNLYLEQNTFAHIPVNADYRITFLPLNGLRMRYFDAVLMVGCDETKLPAPLSETLFFSSTLRAQLGLMDRMRSQQQQLSDLAELFLNQSILCFSWQVQGRQGEPQSLAPWLLRLEQYLQRAYPEKVLRQLYQAPVYQTCSQPSKMPRPIALAPFPNRVSAHGYNALRRCPYQFFSRSVLGLRELGGLDDALEKRDLGIWLHELLFRYHAQQETVQSLEGLSAKFFNQKITYDGRVIAYWQQWRKLIPHYLDWHEQRIQQGWQWQRGEQEQQRSLESVELCLVGRIDRVDHHAEMGYAVLDYKVQNKKQLSSKLKNIDEDVQLPFYALLQPDVVQAGWVTLAGESVEIIELQELNRLAESLLTQIEQDFHAIFQGAPLPAYGKMPACRLCEARGLCRKGYWEQ